MMESSRIVSKKNKTQLTSSVGGNPKGTETDYDEAEVEVEFSNVSKELKDFIIKITKEAISKSKK